MKDPVFLSSPIFHPKIPSQPSLSTTRDDHLIPILSQDNFTFKEQLTSLYMHPTDYTFRQCNKIEKDFSLQWLLKSCLHSIIGSKMELKSSLSSSICYAHLFMI